MDYELMVCPLCGGQVVEEGGYDGSYLEFSCEHSTYMDEYGSVEVLRVRAEPVGLGAALAEAAPRMAAQREKYLAKKEEQRRAAKARRAALTPEEREAEDRRNELMRSAMRNVFGKPLLDSLRADFGRQVYGTPKFSWSEGVEVRVEPGTIKPD